MSQDKGNRLDSRKGNQTSNLYPVKLPYDFVPFAGDNAKLDGYHYPYTKAELPAHDSADNLLSGCLTYQITPYSDIALETRKWPEAEGDGKYVISGSQIRGKIRSNVEILSASYPEFIDRSEMLYRQIEGRNSSGISNTKYLEMMGIDKKSGYKEIEDTVRAGFLQKIGNDYFIIPARSIGDKFFMSVKEFELIDKNEHVLEYSNRLFRWDNKLKDKMKQLNEKINQLDNGIRELRRTRLKGELKKWEDEVIQTIFTQKFPFMKQFTEKSYNQQSLDSLQSKLKEYLNSQVTNKKLELLLEKMVARWRLKAEIHLMYSGKWSEAGRNVPKNNTFEPYQQDVSFIVSGNKVISISRSSIEGKQKGYLLNSTNAFSKRSHYLIGEPDEEMDMVEVSDVAVASYNRLFKKMRFIKAGKETKRFYNLFGEDDDSLTKPGNNDNELPIVFYQDHVNGKKVPLRIGRTPYFKIPYGSQLNDLLGTRNGQKVDYAKALFGYTSSDMGEGPDASEEIKAYKSRLRFSPVELIGNVDPLEKRPFLLLSPFASASQMYLRPKKDGRPQSYVQSVGSDTSEGYPRLNGYKYYHVLKQLVKYTSSDSRKSMETTKKILEKNKLEDGYLKGGIYFSKLSAAELGLLILALDLERLLESRKFGSNVQSYLHERDFKAKLETTSDGQVKPRTLYELIGGAKPYGYGKVKFTITGLCLDSQGTDFESLIVRPEEEALDNCPEYVDAFIQAMNGSHWFHRIHLDRYILSKQEQDFSNNNNYCNWADLEENIRKIEKSQKSGGGYPKNWVLESPANPK